MTLLDEIINEVDRTGVTPNRCDLTILISPSDPSSCLTIGDINRLINRFQRLNVTVMPGPTSFRITQLQGHSPDL